MIERCLGVRFFFVSPHVGGCAFVDFAVEEVANFGEFVVVQFVF